MALREGLAGSPAGLGSGSLTSACRGQIQSPSPWRLLLFRGKPPRLVVQGSKVERYPEFITEPLPPDLGNDVIFTPLPPQPLRSCIFLFSFYAFKLSF